MENKASSTINIKQIHVYHPEESKSINHQTIISLESISNRMSRMLDPPPSSKLLLHELAQWIPLFGTMKFVHACWKLRKLRKLVENNENAYQKENGSKRLLKSGFYA